VKSFVAAIVATALAVPLIGTAETVIGPGDPHEGVPPGFARVLKPGPHGSFWVLVPLGTASPMARAGSQPPPEAGVYEAEEPAADLVDEALGAPGSVEMPGASAMEAAELARAVLDEANRVRAERSLPPLQPHSALDSVALAHSDEMATLGYFGHESPVPGLGELTDRLRTGGMRTWGKAGENLIRIPGTYARESGPDLARRMVADWMNSEGHQRNLLDPDFTFTGIGIVDSDDGVLATQVFTGSVDLEP
jgi:uncharacterized protein YkwD